MKKIVMMMVMTVMFVTESYARPSHNYGNEAAALVAMNPSVVERIREVEEWLSKRHPGHKKDKARAESFGWCIRISPGAFTADIIVKLYWDGSMTIYSSGNESAAGTWYPKFIPPVK